MAHAGRPVSSYVLSIAVNLFILNQRKTTDPRFPGSKWQKLGHGLGVNVISIML